MLVTPGLPFLWRAQPIMRKRMMVMMIMKMVVMRKRIFVEGSPHHHQLKRKARHSLATTLSVLDVLDAGRSVTSTKRSTRGTLVVLKTGKSSTS